MKNADLCREEELSQALASSLAEKKPWTLASLAQEYKLTEKEVAKNLPEDMCAFTSGKHFIQVWEALVSWEKATLIVQHKSHVFEVKCQVPVGKPGHGYYNIMGEEGLGGHIKVDAITDIAFLSMPFMGLESYSVQFFNAEGEVAFALYAGRENHKIILSVKESFLKLKQKLAGV